MLWIEIEIGIAIGIPIAIPIPISVEPPGQRRMIQDCFDAVRCLPLVCRAGLNPWGVGR